MDNLHHKLVLREEQVLLVPYQLQVEVVEVQDILPVLLVVLLVVMDMDPLQELLQQELHHLNQHKEMLVEVLLDLTIEVAAGVVRVPLVLTVDHLDRVMVAMEW